jgi:hypothetical protein
MAHRGRDSADEALAAALARGLTVRDAAAAAGVSERTAHRRNADPEFRRQVVELRAGMVNAACGQLADNMAAAVRVLVELLAHEDANVRHKAAREILDRGVKLRESVEFDARLTALENPGEVNADDIMTLTIHETVVPSPGEVNAEP